MGPNAAGFVFDHLGLVVESIVEAAPSLARMVGIAEWTRRFEDPTLGVAVCFGRDANGFVYELIEPFGVDSPVAHAARTRRQRLNQIAYRTSDLRSACERLEREGAVVLGEPKPAVAFGGACVQFLQLPHGFVVELIDSGAHEHRFGNALPV